MKEDKKETQKKKSKERYFEIGTEIIKRKRVIIWKICSCERTKNVFNGGLATKYLHIFTTKPFNLIFCELNWLDLTLFIVELERGLGEKGVGGYSPVHKHLDKKYNKIYQFFFNWNL